MPNYKILRELGPQDHYFEIEGVAFSSNVTHGQVIRLVDSMVFYIDRIKPCHQRRVRIIGNREAARLVKKQLRNDILLPGIGAEMRWDHRFSAVMEKRIAAERRTERR